MNHIKTTFNDWNFEKKVIALIIHGFAIAHAVTAFTLSQTVGGDELALTALTIAMSVSLEQMAELGTLEKHFL